METSIKRIGPQKPEWLRIKLSISNNFKTVNNLIKELELNF